MQKAGPVIEIEQPHILQQQTSDINFNDYNLVTVIFIVTSPLQHEAEVPSGDEDTGTPIYEEIDDVVDSHFIMNQSSAYGVVENTAVQCITLNFQT